MATNLNDVVAALVDLQQHTRPIDITIGRIVSGTVRNDAVVVHEAAPAVVKALATMFMPSLTSDGLVISGEWSDR